MPHQDYLGPDGEKWPSATELTNLLPQGWLWAWYKNSVRAHGWRGWQKCLAQSKRGMAIGTEVHGLLDSFISHRDYPISGKYESQAYADALFDKVNSEVIDWVAVEPHLISQKLKIHGTADAIIRISTGLAILDWKTSAGKSNTHAVQLSIYAACWNEEHPNQRIDQGFVARVDKKSKTLKVHIDDYQGLQNYRPIVKALRDIYDYNNKLGVYKG